jgi:pectate lyase-like protein
MPRLAALTVTLSVLAAVASSAQPTDIRGHYNVDDFGVVPDGATDCSKAFQEALDTAHSGGGGIVHVPVGQYRIATHLVIPPKVTLEGLWRAPPRGQVDDLAGSVLLAVEGQGSDIGHPFILMKESATLRGLTVFYPEQVNAEKPHPYPWTVAGEGDNVSIIDCLLLNPYHAVDFGSRPTGRHLIRGLYGQPLRKGIYINQCYDVGRVEDVHFWPFWTGPGRDEPAFVGMRKHATAFILGKTDGQMFNNVFSIRYRVGMHFIAGVVGAARDGKPRTAPGSGVYTNCYMDETPTAVLVDEVAAHAGVSFVNGMFMSGVEVASTNTGPVKFTGCGFWGNSDQTYHTNLEGRGTVSFNACHFSNWDRAEKGAPCIDADSRGLIVTGCEFQSDRRDHLKIRIGEQVKSAVITSNLMQGGVLIERDAPDASDIQIGMNAGDGAEGFVTDWIVLGPFPNFTASGSLREGFDIDFLRALGGEPNAVLESSTSVRHGLTSAAQTTVRAKTAEANSRSRLDLKRIFPAVNMLAYAFCFIDAEEDGPATFHFGSNDSAKVWVNGEQVLDAWAPEGRQCMPGTDRFEVELHRGLNPVLVKVGDQGGSRWECVLEVYDNQGNALPTSLLGAEE